MKTRLTWNGSNEAQRQADEAFARLKAAQTSRKTGKSGKRFTKRRKALSVHGSKCGFCGSTERLEVHHLHYRTLFRESPRNDLRVCAATATR